MKIKYAMLLHAMLLGLSGMLCSAQTNTGKPVSANGKPAATNTGSAKTGKKANAKAAAPRPTPALTIPATAVKTSDGSYRFQDAHGKFWIYRQSPFGVSRAPEAPAAAASSGQTPFTPQSSAAPQSASAAASADPLERTTAVADGDTIRFERPTPFGMTKWQKNKNDLTAEEQKVWDREQSKGTR